MVYLLNTIASQEDGLKDMSSGFIGEGDFWVMRNGRYTAFTKEQGFSKAA
jgi:hypothetical protein